MSKVLKFHEYDLILIALNRVKKQDQSNMTTAELNSRYTFANPPLATILLPNDNLFVCGQRKNFQQFLKAIKAVDPHGSMKVTKGEDDHIVIEVKLDNGQAHSTPPSPTLVLSTPHSSSLSTPNSNTELLPQKALTPTGLLRPNQYDSEDDDDDNMPRMSFDQLVMRANKRM